MALLSDAFPAWAQDLKVGSVSLAQAIAVVVAVCLSVLLGRLVLALLGVLLRRLAKATHFDVMPLQGEVRNAAWVFLSALTFKALANAIELDPKAERVIDVTVNSVAIWAVAWGANRLLALVTGTIAKQGNDGASRSLRTHVEMSSRLAHLSIWVVSVSVFLLQFDVVRSVGVSLLASAGIAGVVLGFAAQKSIAQLFAGVQLSITQPIRLGDIVQLGAMVGEVEQIRLTYVVLKTWDSKRTVVPIQAFLDGAFENWSLGSGDVVASCALEVDFRADVAALRVELARLLTLEPAKSLHDGRFTQVAVTASNEKSMTVRCAASVADAAKAFDLAFLLREGLLRKISLTPDWLPRGRSEVVTGMSVPVSGSPPNDPPD